MDATPIRIKCRNITGSRLDAAIHNLKFAGFHTFYFEGKVRKNATRQ